MSAPNYQECPQCGGAIAVEDFVDQDLVTHRVTLLHCDFCGLGSESLFEKCGDHLHFQFKLDCDRKRDPVRFGKFLQRLQDARAA